MEHLSKTESMRVKEDPDFMYPQVMGNIHIKDQG
jgi:hypothetical protein